MMLPVKYKKISFSRWKQLAWSPYTLLRSLEYEAIEGIKLQGCTLDIGGGKKNSYYHLLRINGVINSINIDPAIGPTVIGNLNSFLPFSSASYENVICLNTFEHIYNDEVLLCEILRILKSGGYFHIIAPFLYKLHGSPLDYHRHSHIWWYEKLIALGVEANNIEIEVLFWDDWSSIFSLINFMNSAFVKKILMLLPVLFMAQNNNGKYDLALGFYIHGHK